MFNTRKLTLCAILSALSVILAVLIHFPLFPAAAFLEYDPADIPIFISSFALGPVLGIVTTVITSVVQGTTVSAASGIAGIIMHIISTGSFVLVSGLYYKKRKTKTAALVSLVLGTITMTIVMVLLNLVITPLFLGAPLEAVISMLVPVIIPFNFAKAAINSLITYIVYPHISPYIKKFNAH